MRLLGLTQQIPETGVVSRLEPGRDSYGLEHNPGADRAGSPEASLDSQVAASLFMCGPLFVQLPSFMKDTGPTE